MLLGESFPNTQALARRGIDNLNGGGSRGYPEPHFGESGRWGPTDGDGVPDQALSGGSREFLEAQMRPAQESCYSTARRTALAWVANLEVAVPPRRV